MKKFKIFLLCFMFSFASCQKNLDDKDTYIVIAPNGMEVKFDKNSNQIVSENEIPGHVKNDLLSKLVLDSRKIL
ncbi:MAG: hypothetical protein K5978_02820, partial [Campylobacter sp.]|nr:hypothetical protein [Campylobacter sp.]